MGSVGLFHDQYPVVLSQHSFGGSKVNLGLWTQAVMALSYASSTYWFCGFRQRA